MARRLNNLQNALRIALGAIALFFSAGPLAAEPEQAEEAALLSCDFEEKDSQGLYDRLVRHDLLEVVEGEGVNGSKALRASYVGYERGSKRIVLSHPLPKQVKEATLHYDVKFARGFQFVKGGKLHGLGPEQPITGGRPMKPEGWSARAMWRGNNGLNTYAYSQNKQGQYGQGADRMLRFSFRPGRYYAVSIYVKLNDPVSAANGSMRIYVNGKGVADHRGIRFRGTDGDKTLINKLLFSTFHGGQDPSWAPKDEAGKYTTVHAYFDNLAVYEGLVVRKKPGG